MSDPILLHIGCGAAPDLESGAARVVLVEPDPEHGIGLRALVDAHVQVIAAAVAAESGQAPFHRCNFAALSGLQVPEALSRLMPGLTQVATRQVTTLSPQDLIERAGLQGSGHMLRCDAPGAVVDLLAGLAAALIRFDSVWLTVGAAPFYGPGSDAQSVIDLMQGQGFRLIGRKDQDDPDWPELRFRRDAVLERLQRQLEDANVAREAAEAQVRVQLEDAASAREAAKALEAELERLRALPGQLEEAIAAREAAEAQAEQLQARVGTLGAELAEQAIELGKLREQTETQESELARLRLLPGQLEAQAEEREARETEIRAAGANLARALRLQALATADLKDLQERHAELQTVKDSQDALLGQLALQLGDVSDHLRWLDSAPDNPRLKRDTGQGRDKVGKGET
ncbi:hypothetical protein I5535_18690 [Rhodobacteraceae bacterium F11138]|nr:hypothetical protein [Rhodobacteraceae bacterium F11138]